jgi:hypothetical protein
MKTQIQTRMGLAVGLALALLGGLTPQAYGQGATGGTITQDGSGYWVHTFTSGGNFQITNPGGLNNVEVLVVGGGGGGAASGGGGGAGGVIHTTLSLAAGTYAITVGAGGLGATVRTVLPNNPTGPYNGVNSTFGTLLTAYGGGAGAGGRTGSGITRAGIGGGSGGGAGSYTSGTALGGSGTDGQGNAGGGISSAQSNCGGGGGGAGGPGGNYSAGGYGGTGGNGINFNISGTSTRYASGGGGAGSPGAHIPVGGSVDPLGGGGTAGTGHNSTANAANAAPNTGGGGGGAFCNGSGNGGNGGSGIVIVRYSQPSVLITASPPDAYEQATQAGVFTVSRGLRTDGDLIVNFTLASGGVNATPGVAYDYTLSGGTGFTWVDGSTSGSVTIANGATNATITVTPVDDVIYDPAETVIPTLTANANYNIGSPAATVTIHDNEVGNVAPVVSAGANQTVLDSALPIVATLNGSVTDDGQPTPVNLTKTWSQVSGPSGGTATFTDTHDPGTTVSFDQEGVYVLQLRGDDGALHTESPVTISVYKRQVSVAVHDGAARATQSPTDTAAFRVSRPVRYTGEDLVVNYTLGGTAAVGTDYSILPLSGSVIIPQGATDGDIEVTPVWKQDGAKTVVLTLTAGPVQAPYEITGPNSPSCTLAKVTGTNRYWVATTPGGNWNTTANWSDESGGAGGFSVPGSGSVAIFDGGGAGNCALDAAVDVAGINIGAGYSGTISQGAVTITVGSTGWTQAGGAFSGSTSAITLNGAFALSGGTFTCGNQTITSAGFNWTRSGSGTFTAGSGTVEFSTQFLTYSITGSSTFNNLTFKNTVVGTGTHTANINSGDTLTVNGTLTWSCSGLGTINVNTGSIEAKGDISFSPNNLNSGTATLIVNGTGMQTLTGNANSASIPPLTINKSLGTLNLVGTIITKNNWTYTAGTITAGSSTVVFSGAFSTSQTISGSHTLNNVTFYNTVAGTGTHTINIASGTTLTIAGTTTFDCTAGGDIAINTGTFESQGNVNVADANLYSGTAALTRLPLLGQPFDYF